MNTQYSINPDSMVWCIASVLYDSLQDGLMPVLKKINAVFAKESFSYKSQLTLGLHLACWIPFSLFCFEKSEEQPHGIHERLENLNTKKVVQRDLAEPEPVEDKF